MVSIYSGNRIHKLRHLYHPLAPWVDDNKPSASTAEGKKFIVKKPFWTIASIIKTSSQSTRAQRGWLQRQSHHPPREELRAPGGGHPGPRPQQTAAGREPIHTRAPRHWTTNAPVGGGINQGVLLGGGFLVQLGNWAVMKVWCTSLKMLLYKTEQFRAIAKILEISHLNSSVTPQK